MEKSTGPPKILFGPYDIEVLPGTTIELPCKSREDPTPQVHTYIYIYFEWVSVCVCAPT